MKIHSPMGTRSRGKLQPFRWTTPIGTLACVHSGFTWCAQAERQVPFIDGMVEIVGQCWKKVQQHSLPLAATCLAGAGFFDSKTSTGPTFLTLLWKQRRVPLHSHKKEFLNVFHGLFSKNWTKRTPQILQFCGISWIFCSRKSLFEWAARAAGLRRLGWLAPKHQTAVTGGCCWGEHIKTNASPGWGCSTLERSAEIWEFLH